MKQSIHLKILHSVKKYIIIVLILFTVSLEVNAGSHNPPDPGPDPTSGGGNPVGGGAPIGDGTYIFLGAAVAYSLWKMQKEKSNEKQIQL
jgi:hypothetical protein